MRTYRSFFFLAMASGALATQLPDPHFDPSTLAAGPCKNQLVVRTDRQRVEHLLFGGPRPDSGPFTELTNSYEPEISEGRGFTDHVEEAYVTSKWARGRRALWPSFRTFFRERTDTGNVAADLAFIRDAESVEMCSAFQELEKNFERSQWGRGWVSSELPLSRSNVPGAFFRYFTDRVQPVDAQLLAECIERTTDKRHDLIHHYIHRLKEALEIRVYVNEEDPSKYHRVSQQFAQGVFLSIQTEVERYLGRTWGFFEWLLGGTDAVSGIVDSVNQTLERLRLHGTRPVLIEIFHTHPFDSIKILPQTGNHHIIYPELSHCDTEFFLKMVRRIRTEVPIAISAVSGLGKARLSKEFYVYYPQEPHYVVDVSP